MTGAPSKRFFRNTSSASTGSACACAATRTTPATCCKRPCSLPIATCPPSVVGSQLSTWLFQVARSFCIKQRRHREGEPATFDDIDAAAAQRAPSDHSGEDDRTHAREVGSIIQAAIGTLGADFREALVLRDVEGLFAEEAAAVVGIEVGALKSRLHRARLSLKQQLAAVLNEAPESVACPELAQELSAYAASEIDKAACDTIEKHLAGCSRCTAACESLKRTVSLCRALPGGEVPAPVKRRFAAPFVVPGRLSPTSSARAATSDCSDQPIGATSALATVHPLAASRQQQPVQGPACAPRVVANHRDLAVVERVPRRTRAGDALHHWGATGFECTTCSPT